MRSLKIRMLVAGTLSLLLYGAEAFAKDVVPGNVSAMTQQTQLAK